MIYMKIFPYLLDGYDLNKSHMPQLKRMTSFNRFKKFIARVYIDGVLAQLHVPPTATLAVSSKACAAAWNGFILQPILQKYDAQTPSDVNRIKKKAAAEIDGLVNDLSYSLTRTNENWSEQQRQALENQFITALARGVGDDYEGAEFV